MKSTFGISLQVLFEREGNFSNLPHDEVTNHGVTLPTWQEYVGHPVSIEEMRELSVEDVAPLYRTQFWDRCSCDNMPIGVDAYLFDFAVNSGVHAACTVLQKIVGVMSDGTIGRLTIAACASMNRTTLLEQLHQARWQFIEKVPNFALYGKGWLNRITIVHRFCIHLQNAIT